MNFRPTVYYQIQNLATYQIPGKSLRVLENIPGIPMFGISTMCQYGGIIYMSV